MYTKEDLQSFMFWEDEEPASKSDQKEFNKSLRSGEDAFNIKVVKELTEFFIKFGIILKIAGKIEGDWLKVYLLYDETDMKKLEIYEQLM